jgi:protein-disulfide isomerase-like protein with CxxC motif
MSVRVRWITDPACVWSWALEPALRALVTEFGSGLEITFVMGGLAREFDAARRAELGRSWLDATAQTGMPTDPRTWHGTPPVSSFPGCLAVKAAQEQGPDAAAAVLRGVREGIVCLRRKLDHTEALAEVARDAGIDEQRFRIDVASNHMVELLGADLEVAHETAARAGDGPPNRPGPASPVPGQDRGPLPTLVFEGDGRSRTLIGWHPPAVVRETALAVGAEPSGDARPDVPAALARFGRMAAVEVAAVCNLPLLKAEADLAALALARRARPIQVLGGRLWEPA